MNKVKSFYLEVIRIIAAFYVFIYHFGAFTINEKLYYATPAFAQKLHLNYPAAHCFVIVFFVLSGYLISISINKSGQSFKSFITDRLGRLYSVLIPALFFSFLTVIFIQKMGYEVGQYIVNNSNLILRFILNLFFLSQVLHLCSTPPLNTPFWSVQYELFYYLLLSVFVYIKGWVKYLFLIILLIFSWIKVLILFPIWLMGSSLYFIWEKKKINSFISISLFISTTFLIIFFIFFPDNIPFHKSVGENQLFGFTLYFSWNYFSDYLFGVIVLLNMLSFFQLSIFIEKKVSNSEFFDLILSKVKTIANCTYTLYLFHLPLLFLFATILPYDVSNYLHQIALIILIITCVYFIARQTEWKLTAWRKGVKNVIEFLIQFNFRRKFK